MLCADNLEGPGVVGNIGGAEHENYVSRTLLLTKVDEVHEGALAEDTNIGGSNPHV